MSGATDHDAKVVPYVLATVRRSLVNVVRVPGAVIPVLIMPLFFLTAFSGSFSGLARGGIVPTATMIDWVMPYAILQGAAFAGMGSTFGVARDLEGGFFDRIRLSPIPRVAIVAGPVAAAVVRSVVPVVLVISVALVAGARPTDWLAVPFIPVAAAGLAAVSALWALGIVYRLRTQRAMGLVQIAIFAVMFLSSAQVPVGRMQGWLHSVAKVNPLTNVLRLARQGVVPTGLRWEDTWGGLLAIVLAIAGLTVFAYRGLQQLDAE